MLATLPATSGLYEVDLGVLQINRPSQGAMEWFGVVQAYSAAGGDNVSVDCLYFQPLDDGGAVMEYVPVPPASLISTTLAPTSGFTSNVIGTIAWTNPTNVEVQDGQYATAYNPSTPADTQYLKATAFGFAIPSGATIDGIQLGVLRASDGPVTDNAVRLVKAGTVQSTDRSASDPWPASGWITYGGPTDLWGGTWAYSDINNSGFGAALSAVPVFETTAKVDFMQLTVYYTLASGFTVAQDAVVYAGQTAEIGPSYAWRTPNGTVWGPIGSYTGQYMKVPSPAHYDAVDDVLVKASRNVLTSADAGIDAIQAQVSVTPRYAQIPSS